jgi:hypothetical protein
MSILEKTIKYVDESFGGKQQAHFERTMYWLERFQPHFTHAHAVAAYSHDIERAFRDKNIAQPNDYLDKDFLRHHQEKGAEIMKEFLTSEGQTANFIQTVTHLIYRHEEGGDDEQNALKDADSVSFFETNAEMFVLKKAPVEGYEKVKSKLDWMFNRITSDKARTAAQSNYEKWTEELEEYK